MESYIKILLFLSIIIHLEFNCMSNTNNSSPFSFKEIINSNNLKLDKPNFFESSDGTKLAYYLEKSKQKQIANLIFIHGGGAHSNAGYQYLSRGLNQKYQISTYLLDLRGHGHSLGARGHSPSKEQIWNDIMLFIGYVKSSNPNIPIYLGGHSSGCGLILNYITYKMKTEVDGYFFISPEFGYKSNTSREKIKYPFANVRTWVFIISEISGGRLFGDKPAVYLNYPEYIIKKDPLLLKYLTRNMAISITPDNPKEQFKNIDKNFGLFIGEHDELFDPNKVIVYMKLPNQKITNNSFSKIIEKKNHLSILLIADKLIGDVIHKWNHN